MGGGSGGHPSGRAWAGRLLGQAGRGVTQPAGGEGVNFPLLLAAAWVH